MSKSGGRDIQHKPISPFVAGFFSVPLQLGFAVQQKGTDATFNPTIM